MASWRAQLCVETGGIPHIFVANGSCLQTPRERARLGRRPPVQRRCPDALRRRAASCHVVTMGRWVAALVSARKHLGGGVAAKSTLGAKKKNTLVPQNWDHFWIQNWGPFLLYLYVGVTANWVAFGSPLLGPQNPSDKFLGVRRQTPRRGAFRPSQTNCHSAAPRWRSWQICELTPRATRPPLGPSPKKNGDCTRIRLSKIQMN